MCILLPDPLKACISPITLESDLDRKESLSSLDSLAIYCSIALLKVSHRAGSTITFGVVGVVTDLIDIAIISNTLEFKVYSGIKQRLQFETRDSLMCIY